MYISKFPFENETKYHAFFVFHPAFFGVCLCWKDTNQNYHNTTLQSSVGTASSSNGFDYEDLKSTGGNR